MTSEELNCLVEEMPRERVSLSWISEHIRGRSTELVLAILGLIGMLPGASGPVAFLILPPAIGLILARRELSLPTRIKSIELPSKPMRRILGTAAFASTWWDKHGKLLGAFPGMRRLAGILILMLAPMLIVPVPLSNVLPGFAVATLAFACLERDALLFFAAAGAGFVSVAINLLAVFSIGGAILHAL